MQCPFLRKMTVKYCGLYGRTMIPLNGDNLTTEQCFSPDHRNCPLLKEHPVEQSTGSVCPHLCIMDVHYCDVAPVRKLIPCNRATVSHCTNDGHRYCELYLSVADPHPDATGTDDEPIPMPPSRAYAQNHMWLDRNDNNTCHIGVDAFFTRSLGRLDAVSYPYHRDDCRPVVRFTVDGAVFDLAFPNAVNCTEINTHLVVDPSEVLRDPYGRGWLFQGITPPASTNGTSDPVERGLLRDEEARRWMDNECDRLAAFAHNHLPAQSADTGPVMQDGGRFCGRLADVLDSGTLYRLHTAFFSLQSRRHQP